MQSDIVYFEGVRYRFQGGYYQRGRCKTGHRFLHRHVWELHNGPVPSGYVIHHIDGNTRNNDIANLELTTPQEHASHHSTERLERMSPEERKANFDRLVEFMRSDEGRAHARMVNAKNRADGKYDGHDKSAFYAARDKWIRTDEWRRICSETTKRRIDAGELKPPTKEALDRAAEWHRSPEGVEWHRQHGKSSWEGKKWHEVNCQNCGQPYRTPFPTRSKFCHPNCKQEALRKRRGLSVGVRPDSRNPRVLSGKRSPS